MRYQRFAHMFWCLPLLALTASTALAAEPNDEAPGNREIIVYGTRPELFTGVLAETELDENDIAAYGFDTVGDLLAQVTSEVDLAGQGPVVLINGQLSNGINDVSDLPTEAITRIQILPSTVAARLGQSPNRRVVNVAIKPDLTQVTAKVDGTLATRGDAFQEAGELNLLKLRNTNRRSLVLRAERTDALLESDRAIRPDTFGTPFDRRGNVIGIAGLGSEIDPALSNLAGTRVTVVGVPDNAASPTLEDFAANANVANSEGAGRFRTLVDSLNRFSANGNFTQRLGPRTTLSVTARLERTTSKGLSGLSSALLNVPGNSLFSPFAADVSLAFLVGEPLHRRTETTTMSLSGTLNGWIGKFGITAQANFGRRVSFTQTDRNYDLTLLQAGILAGTINPFGQLSELGQVRGDRARSRNNSGDTQLIAAGPLFRLPTGMVRLSVRLGAKFDRSLSSRRGISGDRSDAFKRDESSAQFNVQVPLLPFAGIDIGAVTADVTAGLRHVTVSGTLKNYGAALNWDLGSKVNWRFSLTDEELPTITSLLTDPIVTIENFRVFDFVRQETVLVRYITGGNPDLAAQRRRTTKIALTANPFTRLNLSLNAEYTKAISRNSVASLPPPNAAVQQAFSDRFHRDATGTLVTVDARPVSFSRDKNEFIRWGLNFRQTWGGGAPSGPAPAGESGEDGPSGGAGWRIELRGDHTWFLSNKRLVRDGLPIIDLLAGGAAGYGGGQPRHQIQGSAAVYHRGIGLQLFASWSSGSLINAGASATPSEIVFRPRTKIDLRTFANLGPLFPQSPALKGARVTLEVLNMFDTKQRVFDASGETPIRYQPFLIDPVGRTVKLSLRKVF